MNESENRSVSQVSIVNSRTPTPSTSTSPTMRAIRSPRRRALQVGHGPGEHPAEGVGPHVGPDPGIGGHEPPPLADPRHLGEEGAAQERERRPPDVRGSRLPALEGQRAVDGPAQQDRGQDDRRVHDDAGHRAEHELPRHLAEVRPHRPEKPQHRGVSSRTCAFTADESSPLPEGASIARPIRRRTRPRDASRVGRRRAGVGGHPAPSYAHPAPSASSRAAAWRARR